MTTYVTMKLKLIILSTFITLQSIAQTEFLDAMFFVEKTTHTYHKFSKTDSLQLDFYKPKLLQKKLPLLIYVHGGGFSGGQRDEDNTKYFANKMAEKGYAVASISYRLIMKKLGFWKI